MELIFVNDLNESRLFPSMDSFKKFNGREIFDLAFLSLVTLSILRNDFNLEPKIRKYAFMSHKDGNWDKINFVSNDLAMLLHIIFGNSAQAEQSRNLLKKQTSTEHLFDKLNVNKHYIAKFLKAIASGSDPQEKRMLLHFDNGFDIQDSNYRSVRRLAQDWTELTTHEKSLVITRLLQFFRKKAMKGDILPLLEKFAKSHKLEIRKANNPENEK